MMQTSEFVCGSVQMGDPWVVTKSVMILCQTSLHIRTPRLFVNRHICNYQMIHVLLLKSYVDNISAMNLPCKVMHSDHAIFVFYSIVVNFDLGG